MQSELKEDREKMKRELKGEVMVGSLVLPTSLVVILKYSRVEEMQRELQGQEGYMVDEMQRELKL